MVALNSLDNRLYLNFMQYWLFVSTEQSLFLSFGVAFMTPLAEMLFCCSTYSNDWTLKSGYLTFFCACCVFTPFSFVPRLSWLVFSMMPWLFWSNLVDVHRLKMSKFHLVHQGVNVEVRWRKVFSGYCCLACLCFFSFFLSLGCWLSRELLNLQGRVFYSVLLRSTTDTKNFPSGLLFFLFFLSLVLYLLQCN